MRDLRLLIIAFVLTGCESLGGTPQVDNPVFGPAPPRVSLDNQQTGGQAYASNTLQPAANDASSSSPVQPVAFRPQNNEVDAAALSGSEVVATVNGQPIFASEVLERYGTQLQAARKQASPQEFRKLCDMLLQRDLPAHIDRKLLIQSLRATLKTEQLEMLQEHLDGLFAEETARLKSELQVTTTLELEQKLAEQGTTLASLRDAFTNQRMAMEFLAVKSKRDHKIGRQDLLQYYRDHIEDYSFPAEVKWQQIEVSFAKHGGREQAFPVLEEAIAELKAGVDFGDVAKKYSDGPTANKQGHWGWTQAGSLADQQVEAALFELPLGQVSEVFTSERSFQLVKVLDRKPAGAKPFVELQDEIRELLDKREREAARLKVIEDLRAGAIIESAFVAEKP